MRINVHHAEGVLGITEKDADFICFNDAKQICGREYTADEVFSEIVKDKEFYRDSSGGVTFSRGECMLQNDFLCDILKMCREEGIYTAVDTASCVPWEYFEKVLPFTDLFFYDIKFFDSELHKKYTGVSNELILSNLEKIFACGADVWIRIPIIFGLNDNVCEINGIKEFLSPYKPLKIELLPYHKMGEHKYDVLGEKFTEFAVPSENVMNKLKNVLNM